MNNLIIFPEDKLPENISNELTEDPYLVTAEEIIRRSRSHSEEDYQTPSLESVTVKPTLDFPPNLAIPPKIERKPKLGGYSEEGKTDINGYIKHESFEKSFTKRETKFDPIISDSDSDSDTVFSDINRRLRSDLSIRRPLIKNGKGFSSKTGSSSLDKKKVRFQKDYNQILYEVDDESDELTAKILRGRSRRSRLICLLTFLSANLLAAIIVSLLFYSHPLSGSTSLTALCPKILSKPMGNKTFDDIGYLAGSLVAGNGRIIKVNDKTLFLTAFKESKNCPDCNGVLALDVDKWTKRNIPFWVYNCEPYGCQPIVDLVCGDDLDGDGVSDCAIVMESAAQVSMEVISGRKGKRLYQYRKAGSIVFIPQWIPDTGNDGTPDLLLTVTEMSETADSGFESKLILLKTRKTAGGLEYVEKNLMEKSVIDDSMSQSVLLWHIGSTYSDIVMAFDNGKGLYLWSFSDLILKQNLKSFTVLFDTFQFGAPLGLFKDLTGDGEDELVSCLQNGTLAVLSKSKNSSLWLLTISGRKCVGTSLTTGHFSQKNKGLCIAAQFRVEKGEQIETYIIHGESGEILQKSILPSAFSFESPLMTFPVGNGQDRLVSWVANKSEIQLVAFGYPWIGKQSLLYMTEHINDQGFISNPALITERFSGCLHTDLKTNETHFLFAVNSPQTSTLVVNKLKLTCVCGQSICGKIIGS